MNHTLLNLKIDHNNIGYSGAELFAKSLEKNQTLTSFDICQNDIQDAGAQAIAEVIKTNHTLTEIDISHNKIGDICVSPLAQALEKNKTLTSLIIDGNKLQLTESKSLRIAMKANFSVISCGLPDFDRIMIRNNNYLKMWQKITPIVSCLKHCETCRIKESIWDLTKSTILPFLGEKQILFQDKILYALVDKLIS